MLQFQHELRHIINNLSNITELSIIMMMIINEIYVHLVFSVLSE